MTEQQSGVGAPGTLIHECKCGNRVVIPPEQVGNELRCPECLAILRPRDYMAEEEGAKARKKRRKKQEALDAPGLLRCKCGFQMQVNPAQADQPVRCPECLAIIRPEEAPQEPARRPGREGGGFFKDWDWRLIGKNLVLFTAIYGIGLALAGGVGAAIVGPRLSSALLWHVAAKTGVYFGGLLGVLLGATWAVLRGAELPLGRGLLVGLFFGSILAAVDFAVEKTFVTFIEVRAMECFAVGLMGGLLAALVLGWIKGAIDEG